MDPYAYPRNPDRGCFSFTCGCCSGGCLSAAVIGMIAVLVFVYGYKLGMVENPREFQYIQVEENDMTPVLAPGDFILVDREAYIDHPIERGDVVWVHGETADGDGLFLRVAGLPAESVSFNASGELMIDGVEFTRHPRLAERDYRFEGAVPEPHALGPNEYYLLGDNRSEARDSRKAGPFEKKQFRGQVLSILFPPNRMGILEP